jgi:uncharacterized membrane protein
LYTDSIGVSSWEGDYSTASQLLGIFSNNTFASFISNSCVVICFDRDNPSPDPAQERVFKMRKQICCVKLLWIISLWTRFCRLIFQR